MRILLYGSFGWDHLGSSYQRAFEQLGHTVIPADFREQHRYLASWLRNRVLHRATLPSLRLRNKGSAAWNEKFLAQVRNDSPDLVFIHNGEFLMPDTLRRIRESGVPVFIFHADNPFPPSVNNRPETVPCIAECDVYFTWSRSLLTRLESEGAPRSCYLPFAWDPVIFPSPAGTNGHDQPYDVAFVGGWDREREELLTDVALKFELKIWGTEYWRTRTRSSSPLKNCWQGRPVHGAEAASVLRKTKVVLNLLRKQNPDGTNMRTFEVPGSGGFSLATRTPGALEIFPEGEAGTYYDSPEELAFQIARCLGDASLRQSIKSRATRIVQDHTYSHRAQTVLSCAARA